MCGIFGFIGASIEYDLTQSAKLLSHRGPDAFSSYSNKQHGIYLAHCRLSIIDLSENGKQPISNEDGTVWLTCNGEIYNFEELRKELVNLDHIFKSRTDSEVIIHAYEEWGTACLERFNGMFAFALWDEKDQILFLARDRLGIKPLYYACLNDHFVFASEPKAIVTLPFYKKEIHYPALFSLLIYRYIAGSKSIWKGIDRLAPGHFLLFNQEKKSLATNKYWQIPLEQKAWTESDAVECLDELLTSSIRYRLISDVPVGIFLSGGLDSTAITAIASAQSPKINTFSIGFDGSPNSELPDARTVSTHFQTTHHQDIVGTHNYESLQRLFWFYDEPLGDSSIIPTYLVCQIARKYATVALSGDGGDELFGGYKWYTKFQSYVRWKGLALLLTPISQFLGAKGQLLKKTRNKFDLYRQLTSPRFNLFELKKLFPQAMPEEFPQSENYLLQRHYHEDLGPYKRWQYLDAVTFMTDDILTKTDRASMAHSLEVRVPFLDHRLVEFAFSLPENLCIRNGKKKYLLQRLLMDQIPQNILNKPKQGFSCPVLDFWPVNAMLEEIKKGELLKHGIMDKQSWSELVARPSSPNWEAKIWLLAVLERWCRQWLTH